jgi:DNA polymerase-3 subunit epsilon
MLTNISLKRPLAFLDLETTGVNPWRDRIVEISVLLVQPSGEVTQRTRRINPGMAIPAEASALHGITDADAAGEPPFPDVARALLCELDGCDLCGYNLKRFDLRVLCAEFRRAGLELALRGREVIDLQEMYHQREPRDLAAAVRRYLRREHEGAHSAAADVLASACLLDAMLACHADLPRDVPGLAALHASPLVVDSEGFFCRVGAEVRFARGSRVRGLSVAAVAASPQLRGFLRWMLQQDLAEDTKEVARQALAAYPLETLVHRSSVGPLPADRSGGPVSGDGSSIDSGDQP